MICIGAAEENTVFDLGRYTDKPEFSQNATVNPQVSQGEQNAVETLSLFLTHRMMGAVGDMRKLATAHMKASQPKLFVMQYGHFTHWRITDVRTRATTTSSPRSRRGKKDQTHDYVLVAVGGKLLVDERR